MRSYPFVGSIIFVSNIMVQKSGYMFVCTFFASQRHCIGLFLFVGNSLSCFRCFILSCCTCSSRQLHAFLIISNSRRQLANDIICLQFFSCPMHKMFYLFCGSYPAHRTTYWLNTVLFILQHILRTFFFLFIYYVCRRTVENERWIEYEKNKS